MLFRERQTNEKISNMSNGSDNGKLGLRWRVVRSDFFFAITMTWLHMWIDRVETSQLLTFNDVLVGDFVEAHDEVRWCGANT